MVLISSKPYEMAGVEQTLDMYATTIQLAPLGRMTRKRSGRNLLGRRYTRLENAAKLRGYRALLSKDGKRPIITRPSKSPHPHPHKKRVHCRSLGVFARHLRNFDVFPRLRIHFFALSTRSFFPGCFSHREGPAGTLVRQYLTLPSPSTVR